MPEQLNSTMASPVTNAIAGKQNNFGIIRVLLALMVIVSHVREIMDGNRSHELLTQIFHTLSLGDVAVDLFFVISGCLILQSWQRNPTVWHYLMRRAFRIYPAFIVMSAACVLIVGPAICTNHHYWQHINLLQLLKSSAALASPVLHVEFSRLPYAQINRSVWTIIYEFRCYLLLAALCFLAPQHQRRIWPGLAIALACTQFYPHLIVISESKLIIALLGDVTDLCRLAMCFAIGCCFYLFRDRLPSNRTSYLIAGLLFAACLLNKHTAHIGTALFGSRLLFWGASMQSPALVQLRKMPDISYGIYLYAWPVTQLLLWFDVAHSYPVLLLITVLLSGAAGTLSWYLVEKPMLALCTGLITKRTKPQNK